MKRIWLALGAIFSVLALTTAAPAQTPVADLTTAAANAETWVIVQARASTANPIAAGFTPADALATATIVPSRLFGVGDETGSISVEKKAELFLVEGDPSYNIGDLRNVVVVMRDGRLMQASDLRTALGISGPPHGTH